MISKQISFLETCATLHNATFQFSQKQKFPFSEICVMSRDNYSIMANLQNYGKNVITSLIRNSRIMKRIQLMISGVHLYVNQLGTHNSEPIFDFWPVLIILLAIKIH